MIVILGKEDEAVATILISRNFPRLVRLNQRRGRMGWMKLSTRVELQSAGSGQSIEVTISSCDLSNKVTSTDSMHAPVRTRIQLCYRENKQIASWRQFLQGWEVSKID